MEMSSIALIDVVVGAANGMMLGALWYSPVVFGNAWMLGHFTAVPCPCTLPRYCDTNISRLSRF